MLNRTLLAVFSGLSFAAALAGADIKAFRIDAQPLSKALVAFSEQSNVVVMAPGALVEGKTAPAVRGEMSVTEALERLLQGSGLSSRIDRQGTVLIVAAGSASAWDAKSDGAVQLARAGRESATDGAASIGQTSQDGRSAATPQEGSRETKVDEIVVTAQKRTERLQDVPVPVTALGTGTLVDNNLLRIQDYYTRVPGFSISPTPSGGNQLALVLRGITTGVGSNPTVGVVIDETAYGSALNAGGGNVVPDLDPSELARIEVLRGPQGTLYGASSMGGLLKFVTAPPSTAGFSGRVQAGVASVQSGGDVGYNVRGAVNVPLSETAALRASAFHREDPGFIDNTRTGEKDVNTSSIDGARLSALWQPTDAFSLTLAGLYQRSEGDGSDNVESGTGRLIQTNVPNTGEYLIRAQAYSVTARADLGKAELIAVSGYSINDYRTSTDDTFSYGPFTGLFFPGSGGAESVYAGENKKFTQEVRLSMALGSRVDWLMGGFYARERYSFDIDISAQVPDTGSRVGTLGTVVGPGTFTERAAFSTVTLHFTPRFDLQLGGRYSDIGQTYGAIEYNGPFLGGFARAAEVDAPDDAFTYLLTPQLKINDRLMAYARFASGYRPGVPNDVSLLAGVPGASKADRTQNYEIGIKGTAADEMISFDASLYRIDWQDIQLRLRYPNTGFYYLDNAAEAQSQGAELALEVRPAQHTTISLQTAWNDATLTAPFPARSDSRGFDGDRLPLSSRFSGSLSLNQDFPVTAHWMGYANATVSYVGDRVGVFQGPPQSDPAPTAPRQDYPAYTRIDISAGLRAAGWSASVFVNNLSDERGMLGGGIGTFPPNAFIYIRPRTIGMTVSKDFQ